MLTLIQNETIDLREADCLAFMRSLPENSAAACLLDPPYNIGYGYKSYADNLPDADYLSWQLDVLTEIARVVRPGGSVLYLHYPEFASRIFWSAPEVCTLTPYKLITWTYNTHTGGTPLRRGTRLWCWWANDAEEPAYIGDSARRGTYRNPTDKRVAKLIEQGASPVDFDWWHYEQVKNVSAEKRAHPCQLPEAMVSRLVEMVAAPGERVLDPFAGSGTTAVACARMGRQFVGCDSDADYVALGNAAAAQASQQGRLF